MLVADQEVVGLGLTAFGILQIYAADPEILP